jgi:uncharacterized protein (DUF1697 family)
MPTVILLRAANVGGHAVFRPSLLPARLPDLGLASLGAAGTFVASANKTDSAILKAMRAHLPAGAGLVACPAAELLALLANDPFDDPRARAADGRYLSVLERKPARSPLLPLVRPATGGWQLIVLARRGRLVVSVARRVAGVTLYPNAVVEQVFGVPATTRGRPTIEAIGRRLGPGAPRRAKL